MTLEEMREKIKNYESKWGKLGHTNIMNPEVTAISHSNLNNSNKRKECTTMAHMTNDFYEFRRKVALGKENNKLAHTATINIDELNERYYNQILHDGTLIHGMYDEYDHMYYQKIADYYGKGKPRYFSKEQWDAYQREQANNSRSQAEIDSKNASDARSKWEAEQKAKKANEAVAKKESDTNKNTRAAQANTVLEAERQGGTKAAIDAIKKTDAYKEYFNKVYKRIAEAGIDPNRMTNVEKKTLFTKEENDEIDKLEDELDAIVRQLDRKLDVKTAIKDDWTNEAQKILKSNSNSHREADREESRERSKWEKEQKEKKAKLDADRAKYAAGGKALEEENRRREETKSQISRDTEKNRQAGLAQDEYEKNKNVTSESGKSKKPKIGDLLAKGIEESQNNPTIRPMFGKKPLTDEEIEELKKSNKKEISEDAKERKALKKTHEKNEKRRESDRETAEREREEESLNKRQESKSNHKENTISREAERINAAKDLGYGSNQKAKPGDNQKESPQKESKNASGSAIGLSENKRNKIIDALQDGKSVEELANQYGIPEEDIQAMKLAIVKHSAMDYENSTMSEYRAFKERANRGARMNALSHSSFISPDELNRKYEQSIVDSCILVHAANYKYYNKIDLGNGGTRYFYTKAEWDAYQDGLKRSQYEKEQKAKKSTAASTNYDVKETHFLKPNNTDKNIEALKKADKELKEKKANKNAVKKILKPINNLYKDLDKQWDDVVDTIEDGKSEEGKRLKDSSNALKKYFKKSTHKLKDADDIANEVLAEHGYKDYDDMLNKEYFDKYPEAADKKSITEYTDEEKAAAKDFLSKTVELANEIKEAQAAEADKQEKAYELAEEADKQMDVFDDIHKEINLLNSIKSADLADALGVKSLSEKDIINAFMPEIYEMEDKFDAGDYNGTYGVEFFQAIIDGIKKFRAAYREARKEIGMD